MRLFINIIFAALSLLAFYSVNIDPEAFYLAPFIPLTIPFFLLGNGVFALYWLFKSPIRMVVSVLVILAGYSFIVRTFRLFPMNEDGEIKVVSYNVRVFNVYAHLRDSDLGSTKKMLSWLKESEADVLCLQEFYMMASSEDFNTVKILKKHYPYYYLEPFHEVAGQVFGMAVFSKYPLTGKGIIKFEKRSNNQIIYADIRVKNDTIRVYNMHLESMSIDEELLSYDFDSISRGENLKALAKYKKGVVRRSKQVNKLEEHLDNSPFPVIVCGDLNDVPYSYAYERLSRRLNNAFESAGNGFGFTYSGGRLFFLRIDHQFAGNEFRINSFKVHREVPYSDHFPLSAVYTLNP